MTPFKFRYWNGVRYVAPHNPAPPSFTRCGCCARAWDDDKLTSWTPAPAGRCPFEYWHRRPVRSRFRDNTPSELLDKMNARTEHCAALILQRNKLAAALREIEARADDNSQDVDNDTDEHSGFIRIHDDAREALAELDTGGLPV